MNSTRNTHTLLVLLLVAGLTAAPALAQDTGSADFSSYVALGDSLTQGFSNGGVFEGVQVNSYPALIARQAGVGGSFEQPTVSAPGIPGLLQLQSLVPLVVAPAQGNGQPTNLMLPRPYNNLAVSGFDTRDVLVTLTGNPIIDITLRGLGPAIGQALALQPTFATVWLGNNDALAAATSGVVNDQTLTPLVQFEMDYRQVVGALAQAGAQVVVANIPNVTAIPFVTTLPPVLVDPATQQPVLVNGQPVPLIGVNPATDRVLLSAQAALALGFGIPVALGGNGMPLPDEVVLSGNEIATISARIDGFNNIVQQVAGEIGAPVVDINGFFEDVVQNGLEIGGVGYDVSFLTGGIFSYDGVHPTPFGYAVVANQFIDAINEGFDADIEPVDLFPFVFGPDGAAGATLTVPPQGFTFTPEAAAQVVNLFQEPEAPQGDEPTEDPPEENPGLRARRLGG
jgi:lysophospholipase L1-like esterase